MGAINFPNPYCFGNSLIAHHDRTAAFSAGADHLNALACAAVP
jgi:hypothetical protein